MEDKTSSSAKPKDKNGSQEDEREETPDENEKGLALAARFAQDARELQEAYLDLDRRHKKLKTTCNALWALVVS